MSMNRFCFSSPPPLAREAADRSFLRPMEGARAPPSGPELRRVGGFARLAARQIHPRGQGVGGGADGGDDVVPAGGKGTLHCDASAP